MGGCEKATSSLRGYHGCKRVLLSCQPPLWSKHHHPRNPRKLGPVFCTLIWNWRCENLSGTMLDTGGQPCNEKHCLLLGSKESRTGMGCIFKFVGGLTALQYELGWNHSGCRPLGFTLEPECSWRRIPVS